MSEHEPNRFAAFSPVERDAIRDGLLGEADLNPDEDPFFAERVWIAERLIAELDLERREAI